MVRQASSFPRLQANRLLQIDRRIPKRAGKRIIDRIVGILVIAAGPILTITVLQKGIDYIPLLASAILTILIPALIVGLFSLYVGVIRRRIRAAVASLLVNDSPLCLPLYSDGCVDLPDAPGDPRIDALNKATPLYRVDCTYTRHRVDNSD